MFKKHIGAVCAALALLGAPCISMAAGIIVGTGPTSAPYSSKNSLGQPVGFDVDLLNAVGEMKGFKFTFIDVPYTEQLTRVTTGSVNIAAGGHPVGTGKGQVLASKEYAVSHVVAATLAGGKRSITIEEVHDLQGLKVGVVNPSASYIKELNKLVGTNNPPQYETYDNIFLALKALDRKEIDAVVGDQHVIQNYAKSGNFLIKEKPLGIDIHHVFLIKQSSDEMKQAIDVGIEDLKKSGKYTVIYNKWFK